MTRAAAVIRLALSRLAEVLGAEDMLACGFSQTGQYRVVGGVMPSALPDFLDRRLCS